MAEIRRLFGDLPIFTRTPGLIARDAPSLHGATLLYGTSLKKDGAGREAWRKAICWLRVFRQGGPLQRGARGSPGNDAREAGTGRPGRSFWPEADKIRRLSGDKPWAHLPRSAYGAAPAWPRASFGLPIIGQFQRKDHGGTYYDQQDPPRFEPPNFELGWEDANGDPRDRLASPLILKPLPLADGSFAPLALWLFRAYPEDGRVVLFHKDDDPASPPRDGRRPDRERRGKARQEKKRLVEGSAAPFDKLLGDGDQALYRPLQTAPGAPGHGMRDVFCAWLKSTRRAQELG